MVPIVGLDEPRLLLTLRSGQVGSHAGEVSWPGGKRDATDGSLIDTALRETQEEVGIPPTQIEVIGELRPFVSRFGLLVTPFVGFVQDDISLELNPGEIEAAFELPITHLENDPRTNTDIIERHGERHHVPVYHYEGFKIWGLTAMILREFLVAGPGYDIK